MKSNVQLFDYHIQARAHGKNKPILIEKTVEAALKSGLMCICFTDHFPLPKDFDDPTEDIRVDYPDYVGMVLAIKEKYKNNIDVCLGAEFDWIPGYSNWIKNEIAKYPFDYVIGSVHYIFGDDGVYFPIDFTRNFFDQALKYFGDVKEVVRRYYSLVQNVVSSKLFDCVGHLDRIKVFNDGSLFDEKARWYQKIVTQTLDIVANSEMTMEINTSGWDRVCGDSYPSEWIVNKAYGKGISLTLGSDAHAPVKVGRNLERAVYLAQKAGYKKLYKFYGRKIKEVFI